MDFLTPALIGILLVVLTLLVYWVTVFIVFYHLIRFGVGTQPKKIALLFLLGAIEFFFVCVALFVSVDWPKAMEGLLALLQLIVGNTYVK